MEIENLESTVGKFIIEFGQIEMNIRTSIISIPRHHDKNAYNNYIKLIRETLLTNDSLSVNLEILKKVVEIFVHDEHKKIWNKLIENISTLSQFRNVLVHGNWYVNEKKEVYKIKKIDFEKPILITKTQLEKNISELKVINLQFAEYSQYYMSIYQEKWDYFFRMSVNDKLRVTE